MQISEIKQSISINTVLTHYDLSPNRNGLVKCPFHASDSTPSLKIYEKTNTFHCFGCGASGDQIEFCTLKEGNKHKGILKAMELINSPIGTSAKIATNRAETNNNRTKKTLMKGFLQKIRQSGLVGEDRNCLLVFCIGSSSKMPKTLHGIIQGNTGVGKTYLMNTICAMMPHEYHIPLTSLTDKSLFNIGKYEIKFHLISLEDSDSMTDEIKLYFRELISKEEINRHVTRVDKDGNYKTVFQVVFGPIASLSCTTVGEIYADDANRCFLISVDESPEQIERIMEQRGLRAAGLIDERKEKSAKIKGYLQQQIEKIKEKDKTGQNLMSTQNAN